MPSKKEKMVATKAQSDQNFPTDNSDSRIEEKPFWYPRYKTMFPSLIFYETQLDEPEFGTGALIWVWEDLADVILIRYEDSDLAG